MGDWNESYNAPVWTLNLLSESLKLKVQSKDPPSQKQEAFAESQEDNYSSTVPINEIQY